MKPKYKNQIFGFLQSTSLGLESFDFEYSQADKDGNEYNTIYFKEDGQRTSFRFSIVEFAEVFGDFKVRYIQYSPKKPFSPYYPVASWTGIEDVIIQLNIWIEKHVKSYLADKTEIDLWEEYLKREAVLPIEVQDYQDLETFTPVEKQSLQLSLNELKVIITKKFELDAVNQKLVEDRLDYLGESLERSQNKTDWKGILINTIISISIALSLDTQKGQDLYNLFIQVMQVLPGLT